MTILCKVDDLEAEYKFIPEDDGSRKCSILFKSLGKKINVKNIFAGEGLIKIEYTTKDIDPALTISMQSGRPVKHIWHFDAYLAKDTPAQYTTDESDGETLEVVLGETAESKLFPCSGFVNGELVGVIRAPALHVRMMGKDVWAFMQYFETLSTDNALKFGKSSLSLIHGLSKATAELRVDNADRRKLIVILNSTGTDFKKLRLNLIRIAPGGDELVEQLGEFNKDDIGPKELSWIPINRSGVELLWVFPTSTHDRHGALKDAIELLGAKVNRSFFADGYGRRQMDDFILSDGEKMNYRIELVMEHNFEIRGPTRGNLLTDSTTMKYVRRNAGRKIKRTKSSIPTAAIQPQLTNDALASADLETKICTQCGSEIAQSARFCYHCGQTQQEQI